MSRQHRKKKKRKKRKIHEDNYETFESDGLQLVRDGKNVFLKNKRSSQEHAEFIARVNLNRPSQLQAIENEINKIVSIFEEYDNVKLLGALSYNHLINQSNPDDDGLSDLTLELALSYSLATSGAKNKTPSPNIIHSLIEKLVSVRHSYNNYMMFEGLSDDTTKDSQIEQNIRFRTIIEALYVRGNAYSKHLFMIYKELFASHDEFLNQHYGFNSQEILDTVLQLENSFCCRLIFPNGQAHPASHMRFLEWIKVSDNKSNRAEVENVHFIQEFANQNPDIIVEGNKLLFYRIDEIETYSNLFKITFRYDYQKHVVKAISQGFGNNNEFLNPKFKGLPLNDSTISTHPVLRIENEYFVFSFAQISRQLFDLTESLIKTASSNYYNSNYLGNKYSGSRDNYLELKAAELFRKIIPDSKSYLNARYTPVTKGEAKGETEIDLLIVSTKAIYLIEMKAGGLSSPAKRGALKSLKGQLKGSVGYGAFQSSRALKYITESNKPEFLVDNKVISIEPKNDVFRITITLEHLSGLIAYMYDLKEIGVINSDVEFAWTCSIFDLMIFAEILEDEIDFIEYLKKRIPFYKRPELNFHDEIDLLGFFLEKDLILDEKFIETLDSFQLDNFSKSIDDYFELGKSKPTRISRKKK